MWTLDCNCLDRKFIKEKGADEFLITNALRCEYLEGLLLGGLFASVRVTVR